MDAPEELRQAVRVVLADHFPMTPLYRVNRAADAVLAVPAIADALRAAEHLHDCIALFADHPGDPFSGAKVASILRDVSE